MNVDYDNILDIVTYIPVSLSFFMNRSSPHKHI